VLVFGVMMAGAVTLVALLIIVGTLLTASVASEADLERLGAPIVAASIPQVRARRRGRGKSDLRDALAALTFDSEPPKAMKGAA